MIGDQFERVAETAGLAFVTSATATGIALAIARRRQLFDVPNERSSHTVPTPRGGGLGIVIGIAAVLTGTQVRPLAFALMAIVLAAVVGIRDDRRALRPSMKGGALVIASLMALGSVRVETARDLPYAGDVALALGFFLTPFWYAGYANAFNFMDGIDGIATLTAIVSGATFLVAGLVHDDTVLTALAAATTGAALGFLPWNFPKARIFMGDAGSLPLGMALALCAALANFSRALPFPASVLLLGPFLFDVTFTLVRRVLEKKTIGEAHKEHLYQRLSRLWGSHARVSLLYAGFSVVTGALALAYASMSDLGKLLSLVLPTLAMLGFAALVLAGERKKGR